MRRKIIFVLIIALLSAILSISLTEAQAAPEFIVWAWVDKVQYAPGDSGTLYITIRNDLETEVYIYNITITYPWHAYVKDHWDGNDTITIEGVVPRNGGLLNRELSFDVPDDGRAVTSPLFPSVIEVIVYTDELGMESPEKQLVISVANPPIHMITKDLDKWMTMLMAAIVICTIIIAAVVFLSTRSPRISTVAPRAKA